MGDIGGVAQAGASIASAGIQAGAVTAAANTQADAARHAADLQSQAAANALGYQRDVFNTQQQNIAPWLQSGRNALGELDSQTGTPGQGLLSAYPGGQYQNAAFSFNPSDLQNDPGYQFQLQQGMQALQRGNAASGVSGGAAAKGIEKYAQGLAGTTYNNAFSRALGTYDTNSQNNLTNYSTNYNAFQNQQGNTFNRLSAMAGTGQTANSQLGSAGQNFANQSGAIAQQGAAGAGNYLTQGANAGAAGMIGLGNSLAGLSQIPMQMQAYNAFAGDNGASSYVNANGGWGGVGGSNVSSTPNFGAYDATSNMNALSGPATDGYSAVMGY